MAVLRGTTADGKPLVGIMDARRYRTFSDRSSFPWLLELHIQMKAERPDGMPAGDELETLNGFEDALVAGLKRVATIHAIGHLTGDGLREVYCYLAEPDVVHAYLAELRRHQQIREFEYRITNDPDWKLAAEWGL